MTRSEEARGWRDLAARIRQHLATAETFAWEAAGLEECAAGCDERARRLEQEE